MQDSAFSSQCSQHIKNHHKIFGLFSQRTHQKQWRKFPFFHNVVNKSKPVMQISAFFFKMLWTYQKPLYKFWEFLLQCCELIKNSDASFGLFSQCCELIKNRDTSFSNFFSQFCEHIRNSDASFGLFSQRYEQIKHGDRSFLGLFSKCLEPIKNSDVSSDIFHDIVNTSKAVMQVAVFILKCCYTSKMLIQISFFFSQCCEHI